MWCWQGAGFGITYPDHVKQTWKTNFEIVNHQRWQRARTAGVDLPEVPEVLTIAEMRSAVLEETREYARTYFPELIEAIKI